MNSVERQVKPIAIVLPQFHPIPENDLWWGNGFTEWSNVVKARPRFKGHYQPHLPKHLGFYDLRLPEAREAQAELAKKHGIYGFCYYHYWFSGKKILEKPVDAILDSGKPDFPFMLCWANENWTRNWDGGFHQILLAQKYSVSDFICHAKHLTKYFRDKRYITVDGKPIFAIYKDDGINNLEDCISAFREELYSNGIEIYLCRFERRIGTHPNFSKAYNIFDAGIEFQPLTRQFDMFISEQKTIRTRLNKLLFRTNSKVFNNYIKLPLKLSDQIFEYSEVIAKDIQYDFQNGLPIFPGVSPGWDNSPRRPFGNALIIHNSSPFLFERWVRNKINRTDWTLLPEQFIFVNAWNEWAEGNHLEPCQKWGLGYLEVLQKAITRAG